MKEQKEKINLDVEVLENSTDKNTNSSEFSKGQFLKTKSIIDRIVHDKKEGTFFFSKTTKLFVARKPLKIEARTKKAAIELGIKLEWDDEGKINFIDYDDSKKILEAIGSQMLNPMEYWQVMRDAMEEGDSNMVKELMSDKYAEWLDRVYLKDGDEIDNPKILSKYKYTGKSRKSCYPEGRPGWFNPENNINGRGVPIKVETNREKHATSWKYWSPNNSVTKLSGCAPIRGYVTSVGKPSWDLGIPVDARQPALMIRECRKIELVEVIPKKLIEEITNIMHNKDYKRLLYFLNEHGNKFSKSNEVSIYKIREKMFDIVGEALLNGSMEINSLNEYWKVLNYAKKTELKYEDFELYIKNSRNLLKEAIAKNKDMVFVMGHKNPDTDAIISCIFEAWRNHIFNGENIAYIPVVQSHRIPDEVSYLLGDLSKELVLTGEENYKKAKDSGLARWVSIDQNREPEVQKYFISIIDHHIVSETARNQDIPKTLEMIGSSTALVVIKYLGMGLDFSKKLCKILYGATLMDTENRVFHKMTDKDFKVMDYLKEKSEIKSDNYFYQELMSFLLNTEDSISLFRRDYKEDWGFGFAVAKIKKGIAEDGKVLKIRLFEELIEQAKQNNFDKNLPLTLLKITDYKEDNQTVNHERVYVLFNPLSSDEFKNKIKELIKNIILFEFPETNIKEEKDHIEFWGTGMQLSRKKTAPILEPVVAAFNQYFYSHSIKKWVKRDFLKKSNKLRRIMGKLNSDSEGRINYVNYKEAKEIASKLNFSLLSLNEYWKVLNDAKKIKDYMMIDSLQGSNFVEFLDSVILECKWLINHPKIGEKIEGEKLDVFIPKGNPGLIHPDDIDIETGIPKKAFSPDNYDNRELWRYWQPDAELVFPCRSYIFLLKQPCWDGKFHIKDSFPNLGIRPVLEKPLIPKVDMEYNKDELIVSIELEEEIVKIVWPKNIFDNTFGD
ncbi:MAG: DHH family phosphoesterase [Nanoarchaeota archaeon]|nr:DHH family phosphoesterase [Nanoarchaeota archaeon]